MKKCPYCQGEVDDDAVMCKHCGRGRASAVRAAQSSASKPSPTEAHSSANADANPSPAHASGSHPESKKCPYCAEEIKWEAIVCKHCGRELTDKPAAIQPPATAATKPKTSVGTLGCATILGLIFLGWCVSTFNGTSPSRSPSRPSSASSSAAPAPPAAAAPSNKLALLSSRGYRSEGGGYFIVEGEVRNISDESLKSVAAQTSWFSKDGTFISSSDALIEFDPLMPGQRSPFKTMTRENPDMEKYSVTFKRLFGPTIQTDDRRKK